VWVTLSLPRKGSRLLRNNTMRVAQMTVWKKVHSQRPIRILLVDNQPACLACLGAVLTCNTYVVDTAVDGLDALMKLKRSLPDLIVSDLRMPRMSGLELLAVVRQRFPHIASIAITGEVFSNNLSGSLIDLCLEKGAYTPAELLKSIETCCGVHLCDRRCHDWR
jgi:CheY-like chemotaxis protein